MADAPVTPGKTLRDRLRSGAARAVLVVALVVAVPTAGYGAMAVVDGTAIAKLSEQLNSMKQQIEAAVKQIEWLTQLSDQLTVVSDFLQEQVDAIGRVGQITLPALNLTKLTGQVMQDAQCLATDLKNLKPHLGFEDLDFGSICKGRTAYKELLWFDPETVTGTGGEDGPITWLDVQAARQEVEERRAALVKEVATSGLAQADIAATKTAETNQKATEELEAAAKAAKDQNNRLAVIAQGQVLTNRQLVQQNQLLAQLVKIQSAMLMSQSLPPAERQSLPDTGWEQGGTP